MMKKNLFNTVKAADKSITASKAIKIEKDYKVIKIPKDCQKSIATQEKINKVTEANEKHKVWKICLYKMCNQKFIDKDFKEYCLNDLLKVLEKDNGYHMRIIPNRNYIVFGDCDRFAILDDSGKFVDCGNFDDFANLLINFLREHYLIQIESSDISYTVNISKPGYFHYSVPKLYASAQKLKEIHDYFFEKHKNIFFYHNEDKSKHRVVDVGIYGNKWFRYPNQTKEFVADTEHDIMRGELIDFVVEHIPDYSECIEDIRYIANPKNQAQGTKTVKKVNNNCAKQNHSMSIDNLSVFSPDDIAKFNEAKRLQIQPGDDTCTDDCVEDYSDNCLNEDENDKKIVQPSVPCVPADPNKNVGYLRTASNYSQRLKRIIIEELLKYLDVYDDRDCWIIVGMALKNESSPDDINEFFDLWNEWSSKSKTKYNGWDECKKLWDGFTYRKKDNMYKIIKLYDLLKDKWGEEDKEYQRINAMRVAGEILNEDQKYFPNNPCTVKHIDSGNKMYCLDLEDPFCPIIQDIHEEDKLCMTDATIEPKYQRSFFVSNIHMNTGMLCTHPNCYGKCVPKGGIPIKNTKRLNAIFIGNQNVYVTNNNYNNNKWQHDIKSILRGHQIYENLKLNEIILESLKGGSYLANAMIYVFAERLQAVEGSWYWFESKWEKCDNIDKTIIKTFIPVYDRLREYIEHKLEDTTDNEKIGYNYQLDEVLDELKDDKKKKKIIIELAIKLEQKVRFDSDKNLFVFNNGVYDFNKMIFRDIKPNDMTTMST